MEPMSVDTPEHDGPLSKPTIHDDDAPLTNGSSAKRQAKDSGSDDDKKPVAKKSKKSAPPPIKKRKVAIESSDEDEDDNEAPAEEPHQVLSVAIKVDPSLPLPDAAVANGGADSDVSEEDVPLSSLTASKPTSPPPAPLPTIKKKKKSETKSYKEDSDSEDDKPIKAVTKKAKKPPSDRSASVKQEQDSDEDDKPLAKKKKPSAASASSSKEKKRVKRESTEPTESESSEEEKPAKKAKKPTKKKANDDDEDDKKPGPSKSKADKKPAVKKEKEKPVKKEKEKNDDDEPEEEVYKWWEQEKQDNSVKWNSLVHAGVLFPPPYEPLPKNIKMKYDGKPLTLPPRSEEVAGFFAAMIETDHAKDTTFQANFFRDFKHHLDLYPPAEDVKVTSLDKCDFRPMFEYFEEEKAKKKSMTAAEKKEVKRLRDEAEKKYVHCTIDGRKEKLGNFRVEPPGLFRGRGEHPKKGTLKLRLSPEDITINIAADAPVPVPNIPGNWKAVVHENTVTWLATWKENVNDNIKYVFLSANSSWKGQSDMAKFEKARQLKGIIDRIRADYTAGLKDKVTADRQRATAMYFIDKLALRAGNEKGEDEADTVGCCSLRIEHVGLIQDPPNTLRFDFLGKDSIRYVNEVVVDEQVFKNVKLFKKDPKVDGDTLFDRLDTGVINKHLGSYMPGLSAKVFRTYNASHTMEQELNRLTPEDGSVTEKLLAYNRANRAVAVLCNHQRAVGKGHAGSMEKLSDKVLALKYQRMKLRHQAFHLEPKLKKKGKWMIEEEDLTEEWIESHEEENKLKEIEKAKKKFEKTNEKKVADDEKPEPESTLKDILKQIEKDAKAIKKETEAKEAVPKKSLDSIAKIETAMEKLDERIATAKMTVVDRKEGAEVSLGTSKINYIDPRVTVAWAKKHEVPVEKLLSKVLIEKFQWAVQTDGDWVF